MGNTRYVDEERNPTFDNKGDAYRSEVDKHLKGSSNQTPQIWFYGDRVYKGGKR